MQSESFDNPTHSDLAAFQVAFGKVISIRESNSGLSQRAFARRADISNNHLREIENGERNITMHTLLKLSIALGTTPSELIRDVENRLDWH